ncbi:ATP-binding protein [Pedobacter sp. MC2016-15]|uniref:sensor histidine kinase n=1 Tax=Pedobacter sp. MC2016-15 TaxID=2994473 RepID=UPI002246B2BB|nr:ATP-binding protein [Pedobacter sp. MC2016-15]MCX2477904.1 ATP-binding protein [Pedobacter sp. MC2016-15]
MQILSKEIVFLITFTTAIFLIAPIFLIVYVSYYNKKKAKHFEEKEALRKTFELELLRSQFEVQEHTMETIATNLHDNIGQLLSLTSMTLSSVKAEGLQETKVNTAGELVHRAIQELRQLSKMMSGKELISKNLGHAIAFELDWLKKGTDYEVLFTDHTSRSIPEHADKELILFRLFQEILSNIIRHAEATQITIVLEQSERFLSLVVKDNGKGFIVEEKKEANAGMGLFNISKRAKMMDGTFSIDSVTGVGTKISVSIPYI